MPIFDRVSDDTAIRAGRVVGGVSMVAAVASVVIAFVAGEFRIWYEEMGVVNALGGFLFSLLLFTVISKQPRNGALWAVGWSGALQAITMALAPAVTILLVRDQYGDEAAADFRSISDPSPEIHFLIWLMGWTFVPALGLFMTFGFLLFPDGRLPSPPWRVVAWLAAGSTAGVTIGLMARTDVRALQERSLGPVTGALMPLVGLSILASITSLRFRYRRAGGDERHQLRWLAYGATILCVPFLAAVMVDTLTSDGWSATLSRPTALIALPFLVGSYAVALFKYRLYDIDVVISRSVTYLGLAAVITVLYATIVVLPLLIVGRSGEGGPGLALPIAAAAVVALLFEPIRVRVQRWANRLVYGERSTPHEVLSQLNARLSEKGPDGGVVDLARLLAQGTGADRAVVWLVDDGMLRPEGDWSRTDDVGRLEPVVAGQMVSDEFAHVASVQHGDDALGAVSITKPRTDPVTPADRELVGDVAAGAGLLLRNIRLNRQLEERARDVRESRRRLIAAQDAERHRLERDLHDGAQQQVVALKVKLGIASTIAEREGADQIADLVAGLASETQEAVDALREVAHGIYPPLLEAEGLDVALRAVARASSIPLVIETDSLVRYDRSLEQTTYFCVVEAVERARLSGVDNVRIDVVDRDDSLVVGVDFGRPPAAIDLTAVEDRIDAFGGSITMTDVADGPIILTSRLPAGRTALEPA